MTTETMEQTSEVSEVQEPTLAELEQAVTEATSAFEAAQSEADKLRFDKSADFDSLKAAMGKRDVAERNLAKAKTAVDKAKASERMAELEGMTREIQDAVRSIITANLDKLNKLEVKGYSVSVTDLTSENGPSVSARPGVPAAPKASGGGGTRKAKTTYDGQSARDFITSRGPEKWDAARVAKILDDPNNLNHYARTLAKALNIEPQPA